MRLYVCATRDNAFDIERFFAVKTKILFLPFYFIYHLTVSLLDRTSSKKTHYVSETFNLNVAVSGKLIIM